MRSYRACEEADACAIPKVLRCLNRECRAPLDTGGAWAEAAGMDERIDILERDVSAIKSEIAVISLIAVMSGIQFALYAALRQ